MIYQSKIKKILNIVKSSGDAPLSSKNIYDLLSSCILRLIKESPTEYTFLIGEPHNYDSLTDDCEPGIELIHTGVHVNIKKCKDNSVCNGCMFNDGTLGWCPSAPSIYLGVWLDDSINSNCLLGSRCIYETSL